MTTKRKLVPKCTVNVKPQSSSGNIGLQNFNEDGGIQSLGDSDTGLINLNADAGDSKRQCIRQPDTVVHHTSIHGVVHLDNRPASLGPPSGYRSVGKCQYSCEHCGALFWLFQQYVVTAFCAIEQDRIDFIREHQNDIRNEYLSGIYDAISRGDNDGSNYGAKLISPQSFTDDPRYMYSNYLDALAIFRVHDRADIVDRVFEMKIHQFIKYLGDTQPFGKTVAVLYTIEFQERGLPHCHTLLWIHEATRVRKDEDIDIYVSAELPLIDADPECHQIVSKLMMHGPCGLACPSAQFSLSARAKWVSALGEVATKFDLLPPSFLFSSSFDKLGPLVRQWLAATRWLVAKAGGSYQPAAAFIISTRPFGAIMFNPPTYHLVMLSSNYGCTLL
ncbi:DNA helicase, partial [Tanacetum coccineum]